MPRVETKTKNRAGAVRTCGTCGKAIEPGQRYFTWAFRYGGRRWSCADHYPKPSQLTQSKLSEVYAANELAQADLPGTDSIESITDIITQAAEAARQVADEYYEASEPFNYEGENAERSEEVGDYAEELESFYPDDDDDLGEIRAEAEALIDGCSV